MRLHPSAIRLTATLLALAAGPAWPRTTAFVPLFNGKDLTGWVNVNCAPETFTVKDGMIVTTGMPTGVLRTEKQYENFILELEWKHIASRGGNAGLFVWGDPLPAPRHAVHARHRGAGPRRPAKTDGDYTSHGDIFSIQGATLKPDRPHPNGWERCLPSEHRCKPAGEWNHYRVECNDGVIKLAVNGKDVSGGSECNPRKGYICLESEGSECHFRNIKIKELPSTNPKPEEIADVAQGFVPLYTGLDLRGWKQDAGPQGPLAARGLDARTTTARARRRTRTSGPRRSTATSS